jgi:hypothetical protein
VISLGRKAFIEIGNADETLARIGLAVSNRRGSLLPGMDKLDVWRADPEWCYDGGFISIFIPKGSNIATEVKKQSAEILETLGKRKAPPW